MPSWIFKIKLLMAAGFLKNFLHGALETYVLHYHAKFCGDWSTVAEISRFFLFSD